MVKLTSGAHKKGVSGIVTLMVVLGLALALGAGVWALWFTVIRDTTESSDRLLERSEAILLPTRECLTGLRTASEVAIIIREVEPISGRYTTSKTIEEEAFAADFNGDGDTDDTIPLLSREAQNVIGRDGATVSRSNPNGGLVFDEDTSAGNVAFPAQANVVRIPLNLLRTAAFEGIHGITAGEWNEVPRGLTGAKILHSEEGICWTLRR